MTKIMVWLKQNWAKISLGILILIVLFWIKEKTNSPINNSALISKTSSPSASPVGGAGLMDAIKRVESEQPSRIGNSPTDAEIYNNPFIKHIRVALNGYLDGSNQGMDDPNSAINGVDGMPNCGLKKFDKSYYKSKFVVYNASDNDYGGVQANIVFINKPDTIFWTWVYKLGEGGYTLRGFCSNGPTEDERSGFTDYVEQVIKESKFSL